MGKYIGQDITYGYFEKQTIPVIDSSVTEYELNRSVSSATAIQVVCERAILEPNEDYVVFTKPSGKSAIKINEAIDLSTPEDGTLSLYVIYLGAKLLIPSTGDQDPQLWDAIDQKADLSQVHTYVDNEIQNLVNGAPEVLDTLKELSDALNNDANFAATIATSISNVQSSVVEEKNRAEGAEETLQNNIDAVASDISTLQTEVTQLQTDITTKADSASLATVATSGSYNDLSNTPTLATVATSGSYTDLTNKPSLATVATSGSYNDLANKPSLATVATSGSYTDLTNKPTIPSALDDLSDVIITSATKGQLVVHDGTRFVNTRTLEANVASATPLVVKGAISQSASLLEVQNSSAATLFSVSANGAISNSVSGNSLGATTFTGNITNSTSSNMMGALTVTTPISSTTPLIIKGAAAQSVNLLSIQNSAGADVFSVNNTGTLSVGTIPVARITGLHLVATSGSYADLTGKPTLFSGAYADLTGKPTLFSGSYNDLSNKPTLATVATTGSYANLINTPVSVSSPTAGQLLIHNGSTFTNGNNNIGNIVIGSATAQNARLGIVGSTDDSGSYCILVRDSVNNIMFAIRNDGLILTGDSAESPYNNPAGVSANLYVNSSGTLQRASSSLKYKKDIVDAPHGLDKVLQLRYVNFKSKKPGVDDKVFGGMIAEEVHNVGLQEFVDYGPDGTPEGIHYANMVSLAFKAIQQLNAKIETLEAKIAELESK